MEELIYLVVGVVISAPILYIVNKALAGRAKDSKKEEKSSFMRIQDLNKRFEGLLEAMLQKDDAKYKTLHSELSEKEKQVFSKYINAKLEKPGSAEPMADEYQVTRVEVIRWVVSLLIESGIVLLIAYFLYVFLSK